jgi:hypothetical protein
MARARISQSAIKRAVAALLSAGVKVSGVRVDAGGFTVLTDPAPLPVSPGQASTNVAELEAALRGSNGKD